MSVGTDSTVDPVPNPVLLLGKDLKTYLPTMWLMYVPLDSLPHQKVR